MTPISHQATDTADDLVLLEGPHSTVTHGATKPVLATFISATPPPASLSHVPCYGFPEPAIAALAHVTRYAEWRRQPPGATIHFPDIDANAARTIADDVLTRGRRGRPRADRSRRSLYAGPAGPLLVGGFYGHH